MSDNATAPNSEEPEVIRKPVVLPVETENDDETRSVTKDRDPGDVVTSDTEDEPERIRKPIVIESETEA